MFVYFQPRGGFNDILTITERVLNYCIQKKRLLLLDTINSEYRINFSDYFVFKHPLVISDFNKIRTILTQGELSVYPDILDGKLDEVLDGVTRFRWTQTGYYIGDTDVPLNLPVDCSKKIIVFASVGGGNAVGIFHKYIELRPRVSEFCQTNYSRLNSPYLAIQVRNTDYTCEYVDLYEHNRELISKYETVYVATDDKKCIDFFRQKGLNVYNFITFPNDDTYHNLHNNQSLDPDTKIKDLMSDIYILTMADRILSISRGGFIQFVRACNQHSELIGSKFSYFK